MIVGLTTKFMEESLEDITEAPGVEVPAIRAIKVDAINTVVGRVPIKVLLEDIGKRVRDKKDSVFVIRLV